MAKKSVKTKKSVKNRKSGKTADQQYSLLTEEEKTSYVIEAADNEYTEKISDDFKRIIYTGEFYLRMGELLGQGMTAVQAYEACGYDTRKLGKQRAEAAANKARAFVASEDKYDWRNYSGMDTLEDILQEKDEKVRVSRLVAKIKVMEAMDEAQKKILPELLAKYTSSSQTRH